MSLYSEGQIVGAVDNVKDLNERAKRYLELYRKHCNGVHVTVPIGDLRVFAEQVKGTAHNPTVRFIIVSGCFFD